ncbi:dipeptidase [Polycladidibacter stylochi]|uniref:dipeptidase n=1 Tax=Polycladidibacter stylochi TaxID=1807766 RepID=UPI001FCCA14B|nr:dipeptidase [Pseudovibrio stylochi]
MNRVRVHQPYVVSKASQQVHDKLIVGDWHADTLLWNRDLRERGSYGHVDLPRLREGNVAFQVFTVVTKSPAGQNYRANPSDARDRITPLLIAQLWPPKTWGSLFERALFQAQKLEETAQKAPEELIIVETRKDLRDVLEMRREGKEVIGGLIGLEGAHALLANMENLDALFEAGYRVIGLQHFFDNALGGSLHGVSGKGLTPFGRAVVQGLMERGMVIDLAHSSPQVAKDVLAMVNVPVVNSHTGIYSHCNSARNISDELMKGIAQTGGVIGIGYWKTVVCDDSPAGVAATIKAAVDLVGVDHVSLGSDYDGSVTTSFDSSELAVLTHELRVLGFDGEALEKIMGGNMIRVLNQVLPEE